MNEASKTIRTWGPAEKALLSGRGIDIGCGPDPVTPEVQRFDVEDGDANEITRYVNGQFDFVFSSHCLEHMKKPREALQEWWKLVKPGGHLIFLVPDEDLYEQGIFPSRFNRDHKATFTLSKARSWSPVSINVLDLVFSLPNSQLISVVLQDHNYNRRLVKHGPGNALIRLLRLVYEADAGLRYRFGFGIPGLGRVLSVWTGHDQLFKPDVLAQIQCIVKKRAC
jgi:SAM-dependent methyltransferase